MKKLLILLIIPLFLTGCFDYQELNERAIVSGLAIDLKEEDFEVTLEILNSKKSDSDKESTEKTYYVKGTGKTLSEAIQLANLKVSKDAYYSHLKVMVISEEIAKEKMEAIIDYLLREPNIRNIFIPVLAEGCKASDILETTSTANPVSSETIQSLLENNIASNHLALKLDFEEFADALVDKRKDAVLNTLKKEEENLVLSGIAAFEGYKMKTILNSNEAATYLVLKNESDNRYLKTLCNKEEKKYITIDLYENKHTDISFKENKILVKSDLKASIIDDECKFDFRNPENYPKVEELFKNVIKEEYENLFKKIKENKTDILGINEANYKKERKDLTNWYQYEVNYKYTIDINKNGLIFKVTHDK